MNFELMIAQEPQPLLPRLIGVLGPPICPDSPLFIDVASRGHGGERVFDSLHCAWVDVEFIRNPADGFSGLQSGKVLLIVASRILRGFYPPVLHDAQETNRG